MNYPFFLSKNAPEIIAQGCPINVRPTRPVNKGKASRDFALSKSLHSNTSLRLPHVYFKSVSAVSPSTAFPLWSLTVYIHLLLMES